MKFNLRHLILSLLIGYVLTVLAPVLQAKNNNIKLDITTHLGDVHNFSKGDTVSFLLSLDQDAYVFVVYETATGELIQLIPNAAVATNFYKAGLYITIPEPDSGFVFKIQEPFGREKLWAFAVSSQTPEFSGDVLANGLKQLKVSLAELVKTLKSDKKGFGQTQYHLHTHAGK
ncbi:MAG: DUF4384 domain-containing protein [Gammaproteobacteria bacterium]|nr:DUF4384 domain-containing protein [Gammaproteobacteria bacterium]MDH5778174.1 DUF4384 domain-containing protein [Gammaproteobacteria bacterium]